MSEASNIPAFPPMTWEWLIYQCKRNCFFKSKLMVRIPTIKPLFRHSQWEWLLRLGPPVVSPVLNLQMFHWIFVWCVHMYQVHVQYLLPISDPAPKPGFSSDLGHCSRPPFSSFTFFPYFFQSQRMGVWVELTGWAEWCLCWRRQTPQESCIESQCMIL